jgi:hypothetical protein
VVLSIAASSGLLPSPNNPIFFLPLGSGSLRSFFSFPSSHALFSLGRTLDGSRDMDAMTTTTQSNSSGDPGSLHNLIFPPVGRLYVIPHP